MTTENAMPETIQACPRGSGTISGVWTDNKCGDEPETSYTRTDLYNAVCKDLERAHDELNKYANDVAVPPEVLEMVGEALKFYANHDNRYPQLTGFGVMQSNLDKDQGQRATAALAALQPYLKRGV